MTNRQLSHGSKPLFALAIAFAFAAIGAIQSQAQTSSIIYSFTGGSDGAWPATGFVADNLGNLYGTASSGGSAQYGTVFKITSSGGMVPLYSFKGGTDGATPLAGLYHASNGYLYGTTSAGGATGNGTVFEVTPKGVEKVLYSFKGGADGANPQSALTVDKAGNLYGTTFSGGTSGNGTVFKVTRKGKETVLHSFGSLGINPIAGVTFDKSGNLWGTTSAGGADGNGTVFELAASSGWEEKTVHDFALGTDGGVPYAGLVFDGSGNIYGATTEGGDSGQNGGGTVFELSPNGTSWTFNTLYGLSGWGISGSYRNVLLDASGDVYATTHCDGSYGSGTVYKLSKSGRSWNYTELYTFTGSTDGYYSFSNLVADKSGNLYGTTRYGGADNYGVVFKVAQ